MNAVQDGSVFITCKERKIADRLFRVPSRPYMGGTLSVKSLGATIDYSFHVKYLPPFISDLPLRKALEEFGVVTSVKGPELPGLPGVSSDPHYSIRLKEGRVFMICLSE